MKRLAFLFAAMLVLVLFALPMPALAETPLSGAVAGFLDGILFPVLNAVLVALVGWAVVKIGRKYHLDFLVENEDVIERAAYKGITLAEEKAAKMMKNSNLTLSSNKKLDLAVSKVLEAAPRLTRQQAEEYVEALLPRLKGAGATGGMVL